MDYLPKTATIEQACAWLALNTGTTWILPRLLENGLMPWFWLDCSPTDPREVFGDKVEGYLAPVIFNGDLVRLEADGTDAVVNFTRAHDGRLMKIEPPGIFRVPLTELRFKREDIESLASTLTSSTPAAKATGKRWTPEFIDEVKAFRAQHTAKATAEHFGVTQQRIREKLPAAKTIKPIAASPFSQLGTRKGLR